MPACLEEIGDGHGPATGATDGIMMLTFTPLEGTSDVVRMDLSDAKLGEPG